MSETPDPDSPRGPLGGLKVLEVGGVGSAPFAAMMLGDLGADIVRLDRLEEARVGARPPAHRRGRRSVGVDLKRPEGVALSRRLAGVADALIEGFRPGVMERLGLGPDRCLAENPRLVYARATGWGQDGPLAPAPGHDLNYVGLTGVLHMLGGEEEPTVPVNFLGDLAGGGMMLAFGIVCAMFEARGSGRGQVVDGAMVDGAALLATQWYGRLARGEWIDERGANEFDGGAPYYNVYATADDRHVAVGAFEDEFYAELLDLLELSPGELPDRRDPANWPVLHHHFAERFRRRPRDAWAAAGERACVTPVLSMGEAPSHPHNRARSAFVEVDGELVPAPAPRFSRTPGRPAPTSGRPGQRADEALAAWGVTPEEIAKLRAGGAISGAPASAEVAA